MQRSPKRQTEPPASTAIEVSARKVVLRGEAHVPDDAQAVVLIAHASGHDHHKPSLRALGRVLHESFLGVVCVDLLPATYLRADSSDGAHAEAHAQLLAERLDGMSHWVERTGLTRDGKPLAYVGIGAAVPSVCIASAQGRGRIGAAVCWDGRPDLALSALERVDIPMALVVAGLEDRLLEAHCDAYGRLRGPRTLEVVAGATDLWEERAFPVAAQHVQAWLTRHLCAPTGKRRIPRALQH